MDHDHGFDCSEISMLLYRKYPQLSNEKIHIIIQNTICSLVDNVNQEERLDSLDTMEKDLKKIELDFSIRGRVKTKECFDFQCKKTCTNSENGGKKGN